MNTSSFLLASGWGLSPIQREVRPRSAAITPAHQSMPLVGTSQTDFRHDLPLGLEDPDGEPLLLGVMALREVAETLGISPGFVHSVTTRHREFGEVNDSQIPGPYGRPQVLCAFDVLFVQEVIKTNPSIYPDGPQHELATAWGVHVLIATIKPYAAVRGLIRKRVLWRASERNNSVQALWELQMARHPDPDVSVFLDEGAVDS